MLFRDKSSRRCEVIFTRHKDRQADKGSSSKFSTVLYSTPSDAQCEWLKGHTSASFRSLERWNSTFQDQRTRMRMGSTERTIMRTRLEDHSVYPVRTYCTYRILRTIVRTFLYVGLPIA